MIFLVCFRQSLLFNRACQVSEKITIILSQIIAYNFNKVGLGQTFLIRSGVNMDYIKALRKKIGHMTIVVPHAVIILINERGEILIEERRDDGYFDFPGGGIDIDEEVETCAKRELFEETGLIADELTFFKVYSGKVTHYKYANDDEISGVDLVYLCRQYHGAIKYQSSEVADLHFYYLYDVPEKMCVRNKQIIADLKAHLITK